MSKNPLNDLGSSLGDYLREQRTAAKLSLRQLSELAGVHLAAVGRGGRHVDHFEQVRLGQAAADPLRGDAPHIGKRRVVGSILEHLYDDT